MDKENLDKTYQAGTEPKLKRVRSEEEITRSLKRPQDATELQEAETYRLENPVTFSGRLEKCYRELKQLDMEMMENINIVLASMPQVSLAPHAIAALDVARKRRSELFKLMRFLQDEINANKDAANAGVPVASHYL